MKKFIHPNDLNIEFIFKPYKNIGLVSVSVGDGDGDGNTQVFQIKTNTEDDVIKTDIYVNTNANMYLGGENGSHRLNLLIKHNVDGFLKLMAYIEKGSELVTFDIKKTFISLEGMDESNETKDILTKITGLEFDKETIKNLEMDFEIGSGIFMEKVGEYVVIFVKNDYYTDLFVNLRDYLFGHEGITRADGAILTQFCDISEENLEALQIMDNGGSILEEIFKNKEDDIIEYVIKSNLIKHLFKFYGVYKQKENVTINNFNYNVYWG